MNNFSDFEKLMKEIFGMVKKYSLLKKEEISVTELVGEFTDFRRMKCKNRYWNDLVCEGMVVANYFYMDPEKGKERFEEFKTFFNDLFLWVRRNCNNDRSDAHYDSIFDELAEFGKRYYGTAYYGMCLEGSETVFNELEREITQ